MGVVYRAIDSQLRRAVAVKQLSEAGRLTQGAHQRLRSEAATMGRINHPNVVPIFDMVTEGGETSLVMEYVEGQTLHQWLREHDLCITEILEMFSQVADGLGAIHKAGVVHCDFKPANVLIGGLIGREGTPKVTDFGLARMRIAAQPSVRSVRRGVPASASRVVFGTPPYMAPEQHAGKELTPATDQYAFCVSLWEALSGTRLFTPEDTSRLAALKRAAEIPPLPFGVPGRVERAIRRGLSADLAQRWDSMAALRDALQPRRRLRDRWRVRWNPESLRLPQLRRGGASG